MVCPKGCVSISYIFAGSVDLGATCFGSPVEEHLILPENLEISHRGDILSETSRLSSDLSRHGGCGVFGEIRKEEPVPSWRCGRARRMANVTEGLIGRLPCVKALVCPSEELVS